MINKAMRQHIITIEDPILPFGALFTRGKITALLMRSEKDA
jgi:Tfp pilus assembly pilus retraction ATPase PilT